MDDSIQPAALYVPAGQDRYGERRGLGVSVIEFKVTPQDNSGDLLILENVFHAKGGPPRHLHFEQDEVFYALEGEFIIEVGDERTRLRPGDSLLAPRRIPHVWAHVGEGRGRMLITFAPAGQMEAFFRIVTPTNAMPQQNADLFRAHGMELVGPPLALDRRLDRRLDRTRGDDMSNEVTIREVLESDWPALFENQRDPASSAMAGVPAREWDVYIAHQQRVRDDEANLTWTILYDGQIAGDVLSFLHDGRREVGYRIGQEYWGKGIATRALALFLDVERRRPLYGWVLAQNIGSQRVLEKCGFTVIGEEHEGGVHGIVFMLDTPDAS